MGKMPSIKVSIVCTTYNHGKYIRKCLDGFLMQKTNFKYEVLIHDDASTDNTAEIIREYELKFPDIIKPIYQTENQHSKGVKVSITYLYPRVKGKYVAICEGDDFWTDPLKLQRQYDAMENHPEVDICAHASTNIFADSEQPIIVKRLFSEQTIIPVEEVIKGGGGYVATCSLFYRSVINENMPEFRKFLLLDYTTQIAGSLRGGMLYLSENMSSYRIGVTDSWTQRTVKNSSKAFNFFTRQIEMLKILDKETDAKYSKEVSYATTQAEYLLDASQKRFKKLLQKKYKPYFNKETICTRFKFRCYAYFPFVYRLKNKFKKSK